MWNVIRNIQCSCWTGGWDGFDPDPGFWPSSFQQRWSIAPGELPRSLFVVGDSYVTNIDFYEINWELRSAEITTLFNWIFVFRRFYLSSVSSRRQVFLLWKVLCVNWLYNNLAVIDGSLPLCISISNINMQCPFVYHKNDRAIYLTITIGSSAIHIGTRIANVFATQLFIRNHVNTYFTKINP